MESLALSVLRILEEESIKKNTDKIIAQLPIESATYLLNEKRSNIEQIENRHDVSIIIVPNKHMETPDFDIQRIRSSTGEDEQSKTSSYHLIRTESQFSPEFVRESATVSQKAAVREILPPSPSPSPSQHSTNGFQNSAPNVGGGFIKRFLNIITGKHEEEMDAAASKTTLPPPRPMPSIQGKPTQKEQEKPERRSQTPRPPRGQQRRDRQNPIDRTSADQQSMNSEPQDIQEKTEKSPVRRQIMPRHGRITSGSVPSFALQSRERSVPTIQNPPGLEDEGIQSEDNTNRRENSRRNPRRRRGRRGDGGNRNQAVERISSLEETNPSQETINVDEKSMDTGLPLSSSMDENNSGSGRFSPLPQDSNSDINSDEYQEQASILFQSEQTEHETSTPAHTPREKHVPRKHQQRPQRPRPATNYIEWSEPSLDTKTEQDGESLEPSHQMNSTITKDSYEPIESIQKSWHSNGDNIIVSDENIGEELQAPGNYILKSSANQGEVAESGPRRPATRRRSRTRRHVSKPSPGTDNEKIQPSFAPNVIESNEETTPSLGGNEKEPSDA